MVSKVYSAFPYGLEAKIVEVETEVEKGLRAFHIIGLPDEAVREAVKRVSAALARSGFHAPHQMNKKITVNLAPAGLKKQGSFFDLAIAMGFLIASGQFTNPCPRAIFIGELSLQGLLRPVPGILAIAQFAKKHGFSSVVVPMHNSLEASIVPSLEVVGASKLSEVVAILKKETKAKQKTGRSLRFGQKPSEYDFADIKGQGLAKRALEIAAAGGHHVFMVGPPGAGKSILAKTFPSLLPPLDEIEGLEVATVLGSREPLFDSHRSQEVVISRPFRSPHHTTSAQAVLGGGSPVRPGEITLAHRGVLFLDELPEFRRDVLEGLRQPLEDKTVTVSRAHERFRFPANFQLVGAANPCPCGFKDDSREVCICTPGSLNRYERKFSGPLMDRMDLCITVPRLSRKEILEEGSGGEPSKTVQSRVAKARAIQAKRLRATRSNSDMKLKEVKEFCAIDAPIKAFLGGAIDRLNLSMRSYNKTLKVARTIADLEGSSNIKVKHVSEALQYRRNTKM